MPAAPIIGGVGSKKVLQLLLQNRITAAPKPVSAVFYYVRTTPGTGNDKTAVAASFLAGPYAALLAAWSTNVTTGVAYLRYIDDATDAYQVVPLAGTGAIATDRFPTYVSVYMQLNTGFRGKMYRGAKKLYGANEADTTQDVLTGAGLIRWQAVQAALVLPLAAGAESYSPAVVTFTPPTQLKVNPTTVQVNAISNIVLNLDVGTMKRRKVPRTV